MLNRLKKILIIMLTMFVGLGSVNQGKGAVASAKIKGLTVTSAPKGNFSVKSSPKGTFKSYMDYRALTCKSSPQYKLQKKAHTNKENGLRMIKDRYCIALGSYYTRKIGTKVDVVMKSGKVLKCILADNKADSETISNHRMHPDGSVVEVLVDGKKLSKKVKNRGDASAITSFRGAIKNIVVYK